MVLKSLSVDNWKHSPAGQHVVGCVLAALYLPGANRPHDPPKTVSIAVAQALLRAACDVGGAAKALRASGLWSEALALETPGLLRWAEDLLSLGGAVTSASPLYPSRWLALRNGPPALYCAGSTPPAPLNKTLSVVGSRRVSRQVRQFAAAIGQISEGLSYTVVSGGAVGCDQAAVSRCSQFIELVPRGLDVHERFLRYGSKRLGSCVGGWRLSIRAPGEAFSVAAAMERNALIYAASAHTVVVHARFKEGGTWTGATEALRRRLTTLIVRSDSHDPAHRALIGLGGISLGSPIDLEFALNAPEPQGRLFGV